MEHEQKRKDGLREHKRRETHRRLTETGLKLFAENGYEATTLDAIAEASGIARRTFFHYFRSKEEIILAWQSAMPDRLRAEILKQGVVASPIATCQAALIALSEDMEPQVAVMIGRIVQSTEQLRASNQAKFLQMELAGYEALRELWPEEGRQVGLRLAAMLLVGAMRLSIDVWVAEEGQRPLAEYLQTYFECLKIELGAFAEK